MDRQGNRRSTAWVAAIVVAGLTLAQAPAALGATVRGLPSGAAAAAALPEPTLPTPNGWSSADAFPRTSGTGRLIDGALEWSDWVYDAYGPSNTGGLPLNSITTAAGALAPAQGSYVYPAGGAKNNGADIFRAGVALTPTATVWRVDWNTIADPSVPIAEWTFDTDDNAATGTAGWSGSANVTSPGIEKALIVSARRATLVDASGATIATFPTVVDSASRSFVVKIPTRTMAVDGRWRVRLAAGLADSAGTGFAVPTTSGGGAASATAPRVYNVSFRSAGQEPPTYTSGQTDALVDQATSALDGLPLIGGYGGERAARSLVTTNFWAEDDQADTLATGDVSKFSQIVDWRQLGARRRTEPPLVKGWSDRWYVTDLDLGQGVADGSNANPAFLGRVQPYAVYIPRRYSGRQPVPFTWMLHSASTNYNQYGGLNPRLVQQLCEARGTICASTEGFGANGLYQGIAEHDFWQVWRQMALAYKLADDRTVVSGYSMGGLASFVLPSTYPSIFSEAMPLDGGFDAGCTSAPTGLAQEDLAAAADRTANVRWVPFVISDSYTDELSPYPVELAAVQRFQAAGNRFAFYSTTAPEHITTDALDGFSTQVAALHGTPSARLAPGTIDYTWCSAATDAKLGLGPTSVYWLSGLAQRTTAGNATARIVAADGARPEPAVTEKVDASVINPPDAPPMQLTKGVWQPGPTPARSQTLTLELTNVATLAVDTRAAKLPRGHATVATDGPTTLTLTRLPRGAVVTGASGHRVKSQSGTATVKLPAGTTPISWRSR